MSNNTDYTRAIQPITDMLFAMAYCRYAMLVHSRQFTGSFSEFMTTPVANIYLPHPELLYDLLNYQPNKEDNTPPAEQ